MAPGKQQRKGLQKSWIRESLQSSEPCQNQHESKIFSCCTSPQKVTKTFPKSSCLEPSVAPKTEQMPVLEHIAKCMTTHIGNVTQMSPKGTTDSSGNPFESPLWGHKTENNGRGVDILRLAPKPVPRGPPKNASNLFHIARLTEVAACRCVRKRA